MEEELKKLKEDLAVAIERIAKLEGDLDAANKRLDTTQKATMKTLENLAIHTHDKLGRASIPLAI
jgi:predicted  nucleic acid-binding Zn-ribbon protein